jgi:hypothetical protein
LNSVFTITTNFFPVEDVRCFGSGLSVQSAVQRRFHENESRFKDRMVELLSAGKYLRMKKQTESVSQAFSVLSKLEHYILGAVSESVSQRAVKRFRTEKIQASVGEND